MATRKRLSREDAGALSITNVGTPTANTDASTKDYVDTGLATKANFNNTVLLNTSQTITGTKTFDAFPVYGGLGSPVVLNSQVIGNGATRIWHDRLRFTAPTFETSPDGTTWTVGESPAGRNVLDGRSDTSNDMTDTLRWFRWTWINGGLSWATIQRVVLKFLYVSPPPTLNVTVESSADAGTTWVTRGSGSIPTPSTNNWMMNLADNADHASYRVTLNAVGGSTGVSVCRISSLELQSPRWGDQGGGPNQEQPIWWNYWREVGFHNHVRPMVDATLDFGNSGGNRWRDGHFSGTVNVGNRALSETTMNSLAASLRSNVNLTGGGTVTVDASVNIKWDRRFIVMANGRGAHFSTSGYFDIAMPPAGTVVPGLGGAADYTVDANGINLAPWYALYYILPIGGSYVSQNANFRRVYYSGTTVVVPENWVLIAVRNADPVGHVRLGTGVLVKPGTSVTPDNPYPQYAAQTETPSPFLLMGA